jgi:Helix-turn-helix domain
LTLTPPILRQSPLNLPKRGLSIDEAAEYLGVSRNTLSRHGPVPTKIGDRVIYDRRVLDRWLDTLAGIAPVTRSKVDPQIGVRKSIVHTHGQPVHWLP